MIEYDFYKDMKPFVDMVDEELKVWKELAYEWIKEEKPKYIHVQQIDHSMIINTKCAAMFCK